MAEASRSLVGAFLGRRRLKRARREANQFLDEVGRILVKHGGRLEPAARDKASRAVRAGSAALREAVDSDDEKRIAKQARRLNEVVDKHLGFARKSTFREYVESIGLAVLIALMLRAFVVEAFKIPSGSMIPTLRVGDHIFVNKFSYGLRMPFTKWWFWERAEPERGDMVVFMFPLEEDKDFIKRIVGVPGDTLELRNQELVITDSEGRSVPVGRELVRDGFHYTDDSPFGGLVTTSAQRETLGDSTYDIIFRRDAPQGNFGPVRVQDGHVFVMGDNRDNSHDTRFWGPDDDGSIQVPIGNIKGRAMFIWWSSFDFWGRVGRGIE